MIFLTKAGEQSDSALENALSDRLTDIETQRDLLKDQNSDLIKRLSTANSQIEKFNKTIKTLLV